MGLSDHVTISITTDSAGLARASFGIGLFVSYTAAWAERVRTYTSPDGVAVDFPVTTGPEYLAAQAYFSQAPHAKKLKIGRGALPPTLNYTVTPVAANLTAYTVNVKGEGVTATTCTYTSDATATVAEITAGLESLISAVVGNNYAVTDNSTDLDITGDNAGDWFALEFVNPALWVVAQDHADPGIATDLAAIALEDNDWYGLATAFNSNALVTAADAWIQTQTKIYVPVINESEAATEAAGNSDTLDDLEALGRARTAGIYHARESEFFGMAWMSDRFAQDPGGSSWKFARLSGVSVGLTLTATQRANLVARDANFYETINGLDIVSEGTTADGAFIDDLRGTDFLEDDMSKSVFEVLATGIVPFTDEGTQLVVTAVKASLKKAVRMGILAASPAPTVTYPLVADVSAANKTNRILPDIKFTATRAGKVHGATLSGNVSL